VAIATVTLVIGLEPNLTPAGHAPAAASPSGSGGTAAVSPVPSQSGPPSGPPDINTGQGVDTGLLLAPPNRIELYAGAVSITPGQLLTVHVSTRAKTYSYRVERLDATLHGGAQVVASASRRVGHNYESLGTFDTVTREVRANWPVTDSITTNGWKPGVYIVTALDSDKTVGRAIFVVRTPVLSAKAPCFVWSALTYEAYNLWGGANLYGYAAPEALRVSFERPYLPGDGAGFWTSASESRNDDKILAWLQQRHLNLQYTTDYDLSIAPPDVAPKLLIFGRHTEYVAAPMRDWVEQHVNSAGDMNVLNFGANSFYWQVRLVQPENPEAPLAIVAYKHLAVDPETTVDPALTTTRWRDKPVDRPEGAVLGAQYIAVLDQGSARFNLVVTSRMPTALVAGTGWRTGTVLRGLLRGEGDRAYPGSGGSAIMDGFAIDKNGAQVTTTVTLRVSSAGARVFDAGTFAWADGFAPATTDIGVSAASFERFNRNLLAWLGFPTSA
jgi:hypothetical protein